MNKEDKFVVIVLILSFYACYLGDLYYELWNTEEIEPEEIIVDPLTNYQLYPIPRSYIRFWTNIFFLLLIVYLLNIISPRIPKKEKKEEK